MIFFACLFSSNNNIGVICEVEKQIGHTVQWDICQLHFTELPLKQFFCKLDGATRGPGVFSGPIGKSMQNCETLEIKPFEKIYTDDIPVLHKSIRDDLSTDQKYLYDLIEAIQTGKCPAILANKKPGPTNDARFLTLACRVLRLYISTEKPSSNLKLLAHFVVRVYGPMWFQVKSSSNITHGSHNLFKYIKLIEWLPVNLRTDMRNVASRNSYFAHSENILLAMLVDGQKEIREMAVKKIWDVRSIGNSGDIRIFRKPTLNFNARYYYEMIDLESTDILEPPITKLLSYDELKNCIECKVNAVSELVKDIPLHNQPVERAIKMVTESSSVTNGEENRDSIIHSKIALKEILKKNNKKSDYIEFMSKELYGTK